MGCQDVNLRPPLPPPLAAQPRLADPNMYTFFCSVRLRASYENILGSLLSRARVHARRYVLRPFRPSSSPERTTLYGARSASGRLVIIHRLPVLLSDRLNGPECSSGRGISNSAYTASAENASAVT